MDVSALPFVVAGLCGIACTHLTDLLVKHHEPDWLKSIANLVLTTAAGVLTTVAWSSGEDWKKYVADVGAAFVVSLATHYADPFRTVTAVQNATANFGISAGGRTAGEGGLSDLGIILIVLVVLILIFGGVGFAAHALWWVLVILVVLLLIAALTRSRW